MHRHNNWLPARSKKTQLIGIRAADMKIYLYILYLRIHTLSTQGVTTQRGYVLFTEGIFWRVRSYVLSASKARK